LRGFNFALLAKTRAAIADKESKRRAKFAARDKTANFEESRGEASCHKDRLCQSTKSKKEGSR
jgi:hypothetical protein